MQFVLKKAIPSIFLATGCNICSYAKEKPNFVFVYVDDMGWTGTSVMMEKGNSETKSDFYETPNIEKLAKKSVIFSRAYAPASMCTPSRASVLTGKSPAQLHMTAPGRGQKAQDWQKVVPAIHISEFPEKEVTIAEILKKKGYATALFGKWHLNGGGPGKHGFDLHDGETGNPKDMNFEASNPKDIFGITERGKAFMKEQVKAKRPFFLQLWHYAVHSPEEALKSTTDYFDKKRVGKYHQNSTYAAMTKDFDNSLGMILDEINSLGVAKNTYVVLMSDNGAAGNPRRPENYPLKLGKGSLWEGGIRVPLMISGPKIKGGTYSSENVIGFDLFTTFCELAGVSKSRLPKGVEGVSLVPAFSGRKVKRRSNQLVFHNPHYGRGLQQVPQSAIISGSYKLIKDYENDRVSLFDLKKDAGESQDLSEKLPEITSKMHQKMQLYLKQVNAQIPKKNENFDENAERATGGKGKAKNKFISRFDKDSDGRVSKSEFTGPSHRFGQFDKNDDGYISSDEAPTGPPKGRK